MKSIEQNVQQIAAELAGRTTPKATSTLHTCVRLRRGCTIVGNGRNHRLSNPTSSDACPVGEATTQSSCGAADLDIPAATQEGQISSSDNSRRC